jgi:hypothetical protein
VRLLPYLTYGLAVICGLVGVKLLLRPVGLGVSWAPNIPPWLSLLVVAPVLLVTLVVGLSAGGPSRGDHSGAGGSPFGRTCEGGARAAGSREDIRSLHASPAVQGGERLTRLRARLTPHLRIKVSF